METDNIDYCVEVCYSKRSGFCYNICEKAFENA